MAPKQKKKEKDEDEEGAGSSGSESSIENENKRQKMAIDSIIKEYLCPLSLELPVEPVTAEDGRVYNRAHIAKHIENADDEYKNLRSPVTNEKMGPKLVSAVQVQNMIRALVKNGTVDDDNSLGQWNEVDDLRTKAIDGDLEAMSKLSTWYYYGTNGLVQSCELAYSWAVKAADLGNNRAKVSVGLMLYEGEGIERNPAEGALYLGLAVAMGEPRGALYLAQFYFEGDSYPGGFAKDNTKARQWLNKAFADFGDNEVTVRAAAEELKRLLDKEDNNGN